MDEREKLLHELVDKKAGCVELAWHGFIKLKEEGEKPCECKDCNLKNVNV